MSDKSKGSNPEGDDPTPEGDKKEPEGSKDNTDYKAAFEKERSKVEEIIADRKREREKRQAAEAKLESLDLETARKSGDIEQVNAQWQTKFEKREKELKTELETVQSDYQKQITENMFRDVAKEGTKVIKAKQVLAQMAYEGFGLDTQKLSDGSVTLVVKSKAGMVRQDVDKWLDEFLSDNQNLAVNPRKGGGGVPAEKSAEGSSASIADLKNMGRQERIAALAKSPVLRKEWAKQF